jgi:hypothetical protein
MLTLFHYALVHLRVESFPLLTHGSMYPLILSLMRNLFLKLSPSAKSKFRENIFSVKQGNNQKVHTALISNEA